MRVITDEGVLPGFPTSAPEDFARLGFEPQRVPSILAMMLRAENPPAGPHSLSPSEAKEVVEILDKVTASPQKFFLVY